MEQDAHIEGALAAEASLVVLDTLETVVQADGGGGGISVHLRNIFTHFVRICL